MFNNQAFDEFILQNKVVGIKKEPIKLKSGRTSHWYANCRVLSDTFGLIDHTSNHVVEFLKEKGLKFDYVYGVPEGATKLGLFVNAKIGKKNPNHKLIIGRKQPKEYGDPKDRFFIGPVEKGDKAIILEDVTTTGSSVIEHINFLKDAGIDVVAVVALVNRLEKRDDGLGVAEYIKKEFNIPYFWLSDAERLLPFAAKHGNHDDETIKKAQESVDRHSVKSIRLK